MAWRINPEWHGRADFISFKPACFEQASFRRQLPETEAPIECAGHALQMASFCRRSGSFGICDLLRRQYDPERRWQGIAPRGEATGCS